jgi:hypothetical protein
MSLNHDDVTGIHQLYAAYCLAVDDGDGKAFSACFTPEGSLDPGGNPIVGADALTSFADGVPTSVPGIRHVVTNIHVEGDGDEAQGRAYLAVYTATGATTNLMLTGQYRDRLRRIDGAWLFAERRMTADA